MLTHTDTSRLKIIVFQLLGETYGLDVSWVRSIERMLPLTRVPGVNRADMAGVINLRGTITPVIDLRSCLGFETAPYDEQTRILVIDDSDDAVGLIVDRARDLLDITESQIEPLPMAHEDNMSDYFSGVVQTSDSVITLLKTEAILQ